MNIIQSINSVYVLFFVIKMHFYIMKNPFYPLNIKKLNFILIYLLFSILVCMWPFFLAEDFFLSFHGMHLMGGGEEWVSQNSNYGKMGGSVFEAIFRMFMTFLKVIKKKKQTNIHAKCFSSTFSNQNFLSLLLKESFS